MFDLEFRPLKPYELTKSNVLLLHLT